MKFARNITFHLKAGKEKEFTNLIEKEVVPLLRKQSGFLEEVTLVNPKNAIGISLWDDRKSAEAYQKTAYPQVLEKLGPVIDGTPKVETYETASTHVRASI
jgi:quinol monooxygenase YgiN